MISKREQVIDFVQQGLRDFAGLREHLNVEPSHFHNFCQFQCRRSAKHDNLSRRTHTFDFVSLTQASFRLTSTMIRAAELVYISDVS